MQSLSIDEILENAAPDVLRHVMEAVLIRTVQERGEAGTLWSLPICSESSRELIGWFVSIECEIARLEGAEEIQALISRSRGKHEQVHEF